MNQLQYETSPYLLQHAENPVDWFPWGDEALTKAFDEDKPILVSIGYSACHWCHVMEHESFEKETVAQVMNDQFVCIKVDREERPDVDAIYMEAVQAMGVNGGWPLNVFLLPDARPFYGVTYVPTRNWINLLGSVRSAFNEHRDQVEESAEGFARHLNTSESERFNLVARPPQFTPELLDGFFHRIAVTFDTQRGGPNRAPKFPMPSIYGFLLRYYAESGDESALRQTELTLNRMALGGIYDQIGGGFSRYSVDAEWFAPHFEKMLYDNAQLLTLYSEAYSLTQSGLYKKTVYQTIEFLQRELLSDEGGFFSALDADSEGVEGKFYTWTTPELRRLLDNDFDWFADLYHITEAGNWEEGRNILHRTETNAEFARRTDWDPSDMPMMLEEPHARLMTERDTRIRPGLDDKILCSWNGLLLKGLVTAYRTFDEPDFLATALRLAFFIRQKLTDTRNGGRLWHTYKRGRARLAGYLEDYATVIDGYLALYQATFNPEWLTEADHLTQYVIANFDDPDDDFFFFTDKNGEDLIARKKELFDNVVPASNSIMAHNLFTLSLLLDRPGYAERVDRMLGRVEPLLEQNADYLTHWAALYTMRVRPTAEIAIVGPDADAFRKEIDARFMPNKVLVGTEEIGTPTATGNLPLLQGRGLVNGKTAIYVCYDRTCQLPVTNVDDVWALVK